MLNINKAHLLDVVEGLKQLPDNSTDIIIADAPYNIGMDFGNNKDALSIQDYIAWCSTWLTECIRILKDTGTMFIYGFSETLAYISVSLPLEKRWLVWSYTNKAAPNSNFWNRSHESIISAWKDKSKRIFNKDAVREPYTKMFVKNFVGKVRKNTEGRFGNKETIYEVNENGALPRDVIKVPALSGGSGAKERWLYCRNCEETYFPYEIEGHRNHDIVKVPTQKPYKLTKRLILSCKPPNGGLVVIPFIGSGSEALVARGLRMDFVGFDINEDFVNMANSLIERADGFTQVEKNIL
ncbi:MAG: DNA methyltransferase [Patescibacteria group bacterium]|jgi:site-specific DNA-methyltransferase (adenine-specific)